MRSGEHDVVAAEQRGSFAMQVFVGDSVIAEALGVQPVDQMKIGCETP